MRPTFAAKSPFARIPISIEPQLFFESDEGGNVIVVEFEYDRLVIDAECTPCPTSQSRNWCRVAADHRVRTSPRKATQPRQIPNRGIGSPRRRAVFAKVLTAPDFVDSFHFAWTLDATGGREHEKTAAPYNPKPAGPIATSGFLILVLSASAAAPREGNPPRP